MLDEEELRYLEESGNYPSEIVELLKNAPRINEVDLGFLSRAKEALAEASCSALEFLANNPSLSMVELAKRLNRGANAVGLIMTVYEEAEEKGVVREVAKDLLFRQIRKEFPNGWFYEEQCVKLGFWRSYIGDFAPQFYEYAKQIIRNLRLDNPPPKGWKPESQYDPLIDELFNRYWPINVKDAATSD